MRRISIALVCLASAGQGKRVRRHALIQDTSCGEHQNSWKSAETGRGRCSHSVDAEQVRSHSFGRVGGLNPSSVLALLLLALIPPGGWLRTGAALKSLSAQAIVSTSSKPRGETIQLLAKSANTKRPKAKKKKIAIQSKGFGAAKGLSKSKGTRPEVWQALELWVEEFSTVSDAVEIHTFPGGLRGLRACRDLNEGEDVLVIPRDVMPDDEKANALLDGLWRDSTEPVTPTVKLALMIDVLDYSPASHWTDEELALSECGKFVSHAISWRSKRQIDHPALQPEVLAAKWKELALPGEPPSAAELEYALLCVTTRAKSAKMSEESDERTLMMTPMSDMANHRYPGNNVREGFDPKENAWIVFAERPIKKGEQVYWCYSKMPNHMLLTQFGFVDDTPMDLGFVDCASLIDGSSSDAVSQKRHEMLHSMIDEGLVMPDSGMPSRWQPAGSQLQAAVGRVASAGLLPPELQTNSSSSAVAEGAKHAYRTLLRATTDSYSTSITEDREKLKNPLSPRLEMAVRLRLRQKILLSQAFADSAADTAYASTSW